MHKKTLVIGASIKSHRYSNYAISRLVSNNHEVVAIGLKKGEVEGVQIETELIQFEGINTVTIYLNALRQSAFYDYLVSLNPGRVIFNPGTENPELYSILKDNNIAFEESCTLVLLSTNQY